MARGFNLTAEINLRGPANIRQVVSNIRRQLGTINANVNVSIDPRVSRNIGTLNTRLAALTAALNQTTTAATSATTSFSALAAAMASVGSTRLPTTFTVNLNNTATAATNSARAVAQARTEFEDFGRQAGLAVRRFAAFSSATSVIYAFTNAVVAGIKEYIVFDKQLTRLSQVTNESKAGLSNLVGEITRLATGFGVASSDISSIALTLAQAGLSANDTRKALEALAKSALAPSFDSLNETVEGSIALMKQFGISAGQLEGALGSVNAVAAAFAVEASDIITAIQRTGGVFAAASNGVSQGTDALNEFIAVFTSVRATTRESAETIATGLRTIFTRIQRADTIEALKEYGVVLTDLEGKFVGPYEAVRRLSEGLGRLDPRDLRFSEIVEELGGFRQIGKVLPLIQQFATAQAALKIAQEGQGSLAADAAKGQQALAVQIQKVREEFSALVRSVGDSSSFKSMVTVALQLARALIKVTDAVQGILPLLGIMAAFRGVSAVTQFIGGFGGGFRGTGGRRANMGGVIGFASGGVVPGSGKGDKVPAMLEPGEVVMSNRAVRQYGRGNLVRMNKYASGGPVSKLGGNISSFNIVDKNGKSIGISNDEYGVKIKNIPIIITKVIGESGKSQAAEVQYKGGPSQTINFGPDKDKPAWYKFEIIAAQVTKSKKFKQSNWPLDLRDGAGNLYEVKYKEAVDDDKTIARKTLSHYFSEDSRFQFKPFGPSNQTQQIGRTTKQPPKGITGKLTSATDKLTSSAVTQLYPMYRISKQTAQQNLQSIQSEVNRRKNLRDKEEIPIGRYTDDEWKNLGREERRKVYRERQIIRANTATKRAINPIEKDIRNIRRSTSDYIDISKGSAATVSLPRLNFGGKIQKFAEGEEVEIDPALFQQYGQIGVLAQKKAAKDKTLSLEQALRKTLSEQLDGLGNEKGVKELVAVPNSLQRRLRKNLIEDGTLQIAPVTNILNKALAAKGTDDAARAAQEAKTRKVAIAGLFPIDYSKDFTDWELEDGRKIYAYVRGFNSSFMDEVEALQESNRATRQKFAEDVQDKAALGLLANKKVQGPVRPLAIDFDETLALGTKMLKVNKEGKEEEDLPAYANRDKVIDSLAKARPTSLAKRLARVEKDNPGITRQFTRILTARPQSTADIIATTLNRFGLPYLTEDITGVSQGLGTNIAKAKNANLAAFEKLIDDNEATIAEVRKSGKSAFQYGEPTTLSKAAEEKFGQSNIEGGMLESAIAQLLGYPINIDALERNRAIDFPQGLGRGAQIFGLPPDIETEIKRTLDGSSFEKARAEFSRYFTENPQAYAFGGIVQGFEDGSPGGIKMPIARGKKGARGSRGPRGFVPLKPKEYARFADQAYAQAGEYGGAGWGKHMGVPMPKVLAEYAEKLRKYVFESSGAGLSIGKEFVVTPDKYIDDELRPYLIPNPSNPKQLGFYRDVVAKFGKPMESKSPSSGLRRGMDVRTMRNMAAAAGGVDKKTMAGISDEQLRTLIEGSPRAPKEALEASVKRISEDPENPDVILRKIKEFKITSSLAGVFPDEQKIKFKAALEQLRAQSVKNPNDLSKANAALRSFDSYVAGAKPEGKEDFNRTAMSWALNQSIKRGLINLEQDDNDSIRKNLGGRIQKFASGGIVPALLTPGEAVIGPKTAKSIGYAKLNRMNQADRNGMGRYSSGGDVSIVPGTGNSDTFGPVPLPVGSFVIRKKATEALGFKTGGKVQKFFFGGTGSGAAARPDTISLETIGASNTATVAMNALVAVLEEMGVASTRSAALLRRGYQATAREAQEAYEADIIMARAAGASAEVLYDLETALERVRNEAEIEVRLRQELADVTGETLQDILSIAEQELRDLTEAARIDATNRGLAGDDLEADVRSGAEERRTQSFETAANAVGVGGSLARAGARGADLQRVINALMRDTRTLEQMNARYIQVRRAEIADEIELSGDIDRANNIRAGLEQQIEETLRREVLARTQAIDESARSRGETPPGGPGTREARERSNLGLMAGAAIITVGQIIADSIDVKSSAGAAALSGGVRGASQTLGIVSGLHGEFRNLSRELRESTNRYAQAAGRVAAFGASATLVIGTFVTLAAAAKEAINAYNQFYIDFNKNKLDFALQRIELEFERFSKDMKNIDLSVINDELSIAAQAFNDMIMSMKNKGLITWINLTDAMKAYGLSLLGSMPMDEFKELAFILERGGFEAYSRARVGGKVGRQAEMDLIIPDLAKEQAIAAKPIADAVNRTLEERFRRGQTSQDIMESPEFESYAQGLANADIALRRAVLQLENSGLDSATIEERKNNLIEAVAKEKIIQAELIAVRQKEAKEAGRFGQIYTLSFNRMFENMNQVINRVVFNLEKLKDSIDLSTKAFSGQAQAGQIKLGVTDVINNPRAYSDVQQQAARSNAAGLFGNQADLIAPLLNSLENTQASIMSTINNTLQNDPNANNEIIFRNISKNLKDTFRKIGLPPELADRMASEVGRAVAELRKEGDREISFGDLQEKVGGLSNVLDITQTALSSVNKVLDGYTTLLNTYTAQTNQLIDLELSKREKNNRAIDILIDSQYQLSRAIGNTINLEQSRSKLLQKAGRVAGVQAEITPEDLFETFTKENNRRVAAESSKQDAANRIPAGVPDFRKFDKEIKDSSVALRENYNALKLFAENTEYASDAMSRIGEIQSRLSGRISFLEKVVTSTPEELESLGNALNRLQKNMNGQLNTINNSIGAQKAYAEAINNGANAAEAMRAAQSAFANERKETLGVLQDILPFLGEGRESGNIRANVLESLLKEAGIGVNPMFAQMLNALRNPATDPAMAEAIRHYTEANNLQSQANALLAKLDANLADDIAIKQTNLLVEGMKQLELGFLNATLKDIRDKINTLVPIQPVAKQTGGVIYAAAGQMVNFEPKGSDTVPAMLTPGEFVVNRNATQKHLPLLQSINSNKYSKGGSVKYYADGGVVTNFGDEERFSGADLVSKNEVIDFNDASSVSVPDFQRAFASYNYLPPIYTVIRHGNQAPAPREPDPENNPDLAQLKPAGRGEVVPGYASTFHVIGSDIKNAPMDVTAREHLNKPFKGDDTFLYTGLPIRGKKISRLDYDSWKKAATTAQNSAFTGDIKNLSNIPMDEFGPVPDLLEFNDFTATKAVTTIKGKSIGIIPTSLDPAFSISSQGYNTYTAPGGSPVAVGSNSVVFGAPSPWSDKHPWTLGRGPAQIMDIESLKDKIIRLDKMDADTANNISNAYNLYKASFELFNTPEWEKGEMPSDYKNLQDDLINLYGSSVPFKVFDKSIITKYMTKFTEASAGINNGDVSSLWVFAAKQGLDSILATIKDNPAKQQEKKIIFGGLDNPDELGFVRPDNPFIIRGFGDQRAKFRPKKFPWATNLVPEDFSKEMMDDMTKELEGKNPGDISMIQAQKTIKYSMDDLSKVIGIPNLDIDLDYRFHKWKGKLYDVTKKEFSDVISNFDLPTNIDNTLFKDLDTSRIRVTAFAPGKHDIIRGNFIQNNKFNDVTKYFKTLYNDKNDASLPDLKRKLKAEKAFSVKFKKNFTRNPDGKTFPGVDVLPNAYRGDTIEADVTEYVLQKLSDSIGVMGTKADKADPAFDDMKQKKVKDKDLADVVRKLSKGALRLFGSKPIPGFNFGWLAQYIGKVPLMKNMNSDLAKRVSQYASGIFTQAGGVVDQLISSGQFLPNQVDYLKNVWTLLGGAQQVFAGLGSGNTRFVAQLQDPDTGDFNVDTLFRSSGAGLTIGKLSGLKLNEEWQDELQNALKDGKMKTVGAGGRLGQGVDMEEKIPENVKDLISLIFNPYNEFSSKDKRKGLITKFMNDLANYRGDNPLVGPFRGPGANTIMDSGTIAFLQDRAMWLSMWYGGTAHEGWLGQDYLFDQAEKDKAERAKKFKESLKKDGGIWYRYANQAHTELGLGIDFGPLPTTEYFDTRIARGLQTGGFVYAENGGHMVHFQPRGTDTVPAMLTPGEFVVNRAATQKNLPLLKAINNGEKGYSSGGVVYAAGGMHIEKDMTADGDSTKTNYLGVPGAKKPQEVIDHENRTAKADIEAEINRDTKTQQLYRANQDLQKLKQAKEETELLLYGKNKATRYFLKGTMLEESAYGLYDMHKKAFEENNKEAAAYISEQIDNAKMVNDALTEVIAEKMTMAGADGIFGTKDDPKPPGILDYLSLGLGGLSVAIPVIPDLLSIPIDLLRGDLTSVGLNLTSAGADIFGGYGGAGAAAAKTASVAGTIASMKTASVGLGAVGLSVSMKRLQKVQDKVKDVFDNFSFKSSGMDFNVSEMFNDVLEASFKNKVGMEGVKEALDEQKDILLKEMDKIPGLSANKSTLEAAYGSNKAKIVNMYINALEAQQRDALVKKVFKKVLTRGAVGGTLMGGGYLGLEYLMQRGVDKAGEKAATQVAIDPATGLPMAGEMGEAKPRPLDPAVKGLLEGITTNAEAGASEVRKKMAKKEEERIADQKPVNPNQTLETYLKETQPQVVEAWIEKIHNDLKGVKNDDNQGITLKDGVYLPAFQKILSKFTIEQFKKQSKRTISEIEADIKRAKDSIKEGIDFRVEFGDRDPLAMSSGGIVYANEGMMIPYHPRGTDTIPAMLTPGEFVVNRAATQRNLPLLKAINNGKAPKMFALGGVAYLANGGDVETELAGIGGWQPSAEQKAALTEQSQTQKIEEDRIQACKNRIYGEEKQKQAARVEAANAEPDAEAQKQKEENENRKKQAREQRMEASAKLHSIVEEFRKQFNADLASIREETGIKKQVDIFAKIPRLKAEYNFISKDTEYNKDVDPNDPDVAEFAARIAALQEKILNDNWFALKADKLTNINQIGLKSMQDFYTAAGAKDDKDLLPLRPQDPNNKARTQNEIEQEIEACKNKQVAAASRGGIIYASEGTLVNYQPRGTDTVPAMLTPGEFVVNRRATQKNLPLLQSINSGYYNQGGVVYFPDGGQVEDANWKKEFSGQAVDSRTARKKEYEQKKQAETINRFSTPMGQSAAAQIIQSPALFDIINPDAIKEEATPETLVVKYKEILDAITNDPEKRISTAKSLYNKDLIRFKYLQTVAMNSQLALTNAKPDLGKIINVPPPLKLVDILKKQVEAASAEGLAYNKAWEQIFNDYPELKQQAAGGGGAPVSSFATGGIVYANNGILIPYRPRGSDTIPAMLTPGEFVVNKDATQHNLGLLQAINAGVYRKGGQIKYLADGTDSGASGSVGVNNSGATSPQSTPTIDLSGLASFTQKFDTLIQSLQKLNIPPEINMNLVQNKPWDINVNGAEALKTLLEGQLGQMIQTAIDQINNRGKDAQEPQPGQ